MKRTTMLLALASVPVLTGIVATGILSMMAPPLVSPTGEPAPIPAAASAPTSAPATVAPIEPDVAPATVDGDQVATAPGQPMLDPRPMLDPTPPLPPGEQTTEVAPPQQDPGPGVAETSGLR